VKIPARDMSKTFFSIFMIFLLLLFFSYKRYNAI